jgi:hypothetical protein
LCFPTGESEQEKAQVAVQTVQKMLQNLYSSKNDPKFRSIRLSNKAFQNKVASVSGGVELLIAAGYRFQIHESSSESISPSQINHNSSFKSNSENSPVSSASSPRPPNVNHRYSLEDDSLQYLQHENGSDFIYLPYLNRDGFLVHTMNFSNERKLTYTLSR